METEEEEVVVEEVVVEVETEEEEVVVEVETKEEEVVVEVKTQEEEVVVEVETEEEEVVVEEVVVEVKTEEEEVVVEEVVVEVKTEEEEVVVEEVVVEVEKVEKTDNFTSVKIADSFHPYQALGASTMSPGTPRAYYPTADFEAEMAEDGLPHKPYILLSGDDDGRVYVLYPESDARDDWTYQKHILLDTEGKTTGVTASVLRPQHCYSGPLPWLHLL
ncbi:hypothetical protein GWK47_042066 [Chionoecetes opilio]|uniref:Uncharacterized protein n=1 Tax=Chionoecetes opilio TaxID=41210 RepID=A0A8J5CJY9_CHIOP|nr:hypothetical protein GWK47_042066 [Chionoecetes opilio]